LDALNIVLNVNPLDELVAKESVVRSHQERLLMLRKAREAIKSLDDLGDSDGMQFLAVENNGVPKSILLKICQAVYIVFIRDLFVCRSFFPWYIVC
jgi:hypothetical protein